MVGLNFKAARDLRGMVLVPVGGDLWVPQQKRGKYSPGRPVDTTEGKEREEE